MAFIWASRGDHSSSAPNEIGDELQDMPPRNSTETERRNGYRQSRLPDRADRITEDLQNKVYNCSICIEKIIEGNTREYSIWQCKQCYTVFHFGCVEQWASQTLLPLPSAKWKCPHCATESGSRPKRSCWCGKETIKRSIAQSPKPHACHNTCGNQQRCHHGDLKTCKKACHPGPCALACDNACKNIPILLPPKPSGMLARFCTRVKKEKSSLFSILKDLCMYAVLNIPLLMWMVWHIRWYSMPYEYPHFDRGGWEIMVLCSVGVFIWAGLFGFLSHLYLRTLDISRVLLNLDVGTSKLSPKVRALVELLGSVVLGIFFASIWILPLIGFAAGPDIIWYNQMKNSCKDFKARVEIDDSGSGHRSLTKFRFQNLEESHIIPRNFSLGAHSKHVDDSTAPFQYYYRLSENIEGSSYAVDIDLFNYAWRFLMLDGADEENEFIANRTQKKLSWKDRLPPPTFHAPHELILSNGTFSPPTKKSKHISIQPLNVIVADMHGLVSSCWQEPFVRVFDVQGLNEKQQKQVVNNLWTPDPDPHVSMRTASFGHGIQRLDMCLRNFDLGVDELVPFAVIAAYRLDLEVTGNRKYVCNI